MFYVLNDKDEEMRWMQVRLSQELQYTQRKVVSPYFLREYFKPLD